MNWLDLVCLGVIAVSAMISLVRGFVREVLSVVVWVAAFWLSLRYAQTLAVYGQAYIDSPTIRLVAAFAALFILTLLVGALVNYLAGVLVGRTGLSGTDRALGVVFGGLRGVLILGVLVLAAGLTALPRETWWRSSVMTSWLTPWVCTVGVDQWLDGLAVTPPVVGDSDPVEGTPAAAYWREFCRGPGVASAAVAQTRGQ